MTGWDQHAAKAEAIGGLGDLFEIAKIGRTVALFGTQIGAVTANGNEPEYIEWFLSEGLLRMGLCGIG